jgi:hypothetical protein
LLANVVLVMVAVGLIGLVFLVTGNSTVQMVVGGLIVVGTVAALLRGARSSKYLPARQTVGA